MSHWIKTHSSNIQYHYNIKNDNNKLTNNNFSMLIIYTCLNLFTKTTIIIFISII